MSTDIENDLPNVLIRAGRRAWDMYGQANGNHTLDEDVVFSLLAKHLVALATEGMTKEGQLAAAGLRYLISLAAPPSSLRSQDPVVANEGARPLLEFCIDSASAKFVPEWRIRLSKAASVSSAGTQSAVRGSR